VPLAMSTRFGSENGRDQRLTLTPLSTQYLATAAFFSAHRIRPIVGLSPRPSRSMVKSSITGTAKSSMMRSSTFFTMM
jgi:hypothetical protein